MENAKSGGFLVGRKNGKIYIHNQGDLGGILVGKRHSEGGIKGENKSTGQPIEVETGEIQLCNDAVRSNKKQSFEGENLTNREILSKLNQYGGGVAFKSGGKVEDEISKSNNIVKQGAGEPIQYSGGEVILTRGAVSSEKKYNYNGKEMTTREIASEMNVEAGGVSFSNGGNVKEDCSCSKMDDGGVTNAIDNIQVDNSVNSSNTLDAINSLNFHNRMNDKQFEEFRLIQGIEKERKDHFYTLAKLNAGAISVEQALREIAFKEMTLDKNYPFEKK